mmetsp:Transcript_2422/g.6678  ORF Transcript_2422/g.6678 Transcript_2422/m.6678 type:complete len:217 (+) Transcript_2422:267-917(+)
MAFLRGSFSLPRRAMCPCKEDFTLCSLLLFVSAVYFKPPSLSFSQSERASHTRGESGQSKDIVPYLMPMWSATMDIKFPSMISMPPGVKTMSHPTVKASGASFTCASFTVSSAWDQKGSLCPVMLFFAPGAPFRPGSRKGSPLTILSVVVPFQTTPVSAWTAKVDPPFSIWSARAPLAPTLIQLSSTFTALAPPGPSLLCRNVVMRAVHRGASGGK